LKSTTPGINFTNILFKAFTLKDPKSAKKTDYLTVFFALLGSASVKASRKMLVKLTQRADASLGIPYLGV